MAFTNFGEAFARNTLKRFYGKAITPVIANTNYEGEIKKIGDRVNVLMFLEDVPLGDYTVGTDMTTTFMADTEASLIIDQKKYWNFSIDSVDKAFTYVNDADSDLIQNAANALSKTIDKRLLQTYIEEVGAGNRVPKKERDGMWTFVVGDSGTYVTITTTATTGVATLTGAIGENVADECEYFPVDIVGRGFRVCSDKANSPWYRITARTSSTVLTFNNWDGSVWGDGRVIEPLFDSAPNGGYPDSYSTDGGYGCEIEGMKATQVTKTNVYELCCELATCLDDADIPAENRHLTVTPWFKNLLVQASELQPDIAMYHTDVVINGKVGRVAGFDVHMVSSDRFSTDLEPIGSWHSSNTGYKLLANHTSFITFAHKWAESRVVDAENQFAKKYQGLNLYGFKVLNARRRAGAYLYCYK